MDELVYCELLKLKRQKVKVIVLLGILVSPILSLFSSVSHLMSRNTGVSLFALYDNTFMFFMLLFGPLAFSVVAAYLFSREFTAKTLKTILVIPIERKKLIQCKCITLFLGIMTLVVCLWISILFLCMVCGIFTEIHDCNIGVAVFFLIKIVLSGILLYLTMLPLAALAFRTKEMIAPMIAAAGIALLNVILSGSPLAGFFPWTAPYLIVNGRMNETVCPPAGSVIIIVILAYLSYRYCCKSFEKEDIL